MILDGGDTFLLLCLGWVDGREGTGVELLCEEFENEDVMLFPSSFFLPISMTDFFAGTSSRVLVLRMGYGVHLGVDVRTAPRLRWTSTGSTCLSDPGHLVLTVDSPYPYGGAGICARIPDPARSFRGR